MAQNAATNLLRPSAGGDYPTGRLDAGRVDPGLPWLTFVELERSGYLPGPAPERCDGADFGIFVLSYRRASPLWELANLLIGSFFLLTSGEAHRFWHNPA